MTLPSVLSRLEPTFGIIQTSSQFSATKTQNHGIVVLKIQCHNLTNDNIFTLIQLVSDNMYLLDSHDGNTNRTLIGLPSSSLTLVLSSIIRACLQNNWNPAEMHQLKRRTSTIELYSVVYIYLERYSPSYDHGLDYDYALFLCHNINNNTQRRIERTTTPRRVQYLYQGCG